MNAPFTRPEEMVDVARPAARLEALRRVQASRVWPPAGRNINLHIHSFYSYNAFGYSPARIALEARKGGLYAAGLCDFDVLDGMEEFLAAGRILGLRSAVHVETRVFVSDQAEVEINSPGEPGVAYIIGAGFVRRPADSAGEKDLLSVLRDGAQARNRALVARINSRLKALALDYERDIAAYTPAGCPTERHIVRAYVGQAELVFPELDRRAAFWSEVLNAPSAEVKEWMANPSAFEERVRARLVKRGGLAYEMPTPASFPAVESFVQWVRANGAIPTAAWLDGTRPGERDAGELTARWREMGLGAVNLIPDRNWNIRDPDERMEKQALLGALVRAADQRHFPILIGTEMNREDQPFVDDLDGPALKPYQAIFLKGAEVIVGHSMLAEFGGFPYMGREADAEFGTDWARRNELFAMVGRLPPLTEELARRLEEAGPDRARAYLLDCGQHGAWLAGP